jgi:hypothetical protein
LNRQKKWKNIPGILIRPKKFLRKKINKKKLLKKNFFLSENFKILVTTRSWLYDFLGHF